MWILDKVLHDIRPKYDDWTKWDKATETGNLPRSIQL
jgi:hypothetical protein